MTQRSLIVSFALLSEALFALTVFTALRRRLMSARDLIIDSISILDWLRADPDAAFGHAPAQHLHPLLRGYRAHTFICRGSRLPLFSFFLQSTSMMLLLPNRL